MDTWLCLAPAILLGALGGVLLIGWLYPAWETVRDTGVWRYQVNRDTGERRAFRVSADGYQPADWQWVRTGHWHPGLWPPQKIAPDVKHKFML